MLKFLKLGFCCFCSHSPGQRFILLAEPAFSLFGHRSFCGDQTFCQGFFAHAEISLADPLLIPARFDQSGRGWRCRARRFRLLLASTMPASMLLVVGPGLLIGKDSALGDASMVWV